MEQAASNYKAVWSPLPYSVSVGEELDLLVCDIARCDPTGRIGRDVLGLRTSDPFGNLRLRFTFPKEVSLHSENDIIGDFHKLGHEPPAE